MMLALDTIMSLLCLNKNVNMNIISCSSFHVKVIFPSPLLPVPLPSLPTPFFPYSCSLFHELILKHWASLSLQLSPEEGYVSAKEDSFLYLPHSCEEEGLPDKALFRADLALVSGYNLPSFLSKLLMCLIFAFQNILKSYCIRCSLCFGKLSISVVFIVPKREEKQTMWKVFVESWFAIHYVNRINLYIILEVVQALVYSNFMFGLL